MSTATHPIDFDIIETGLTLNLNPISPKGKEFVEHYKDIMECTINNGSYVFESSRRAEVIYELFDHGMTASMELTRFGGHLMI